MALLSTEMSREDIRLVGKIKVSRRRGQELGGSRTEKVRSREEGMHELVEG